ncbi:unnamed protein product, partial [marine sediment metagenome]
MSFNFLELNSMLKGVRSIHFIGIGGIGMSGLARVLLQMGYLISGSDKRKNNLTKKLQAKGAIDAGVDAYINTCINGMGERAGNADLISVILTLRKSNGLKDLNLLDERVDLSKAWKIAKYASYAFGIPI